MRKAALQNAASFLDQAAAMYPDRTMIVFDGERYSFDQMSRWSSQLANGLVRAGIREGDRVALCCANRPGFIVVYYAALRIGATVVVLSTGLKERDLSEQLTDSGARAFFYFDGLGADEFTPVALVAAVDAGCQDRTWAIPKFLSNDPTPSGVPGMAEVMNGQSDQFRTIACARDQTAIIPYTSGTSGQPKGVEITHANIVSMVELNIPLSDWASGSVRLVANPLFHVMGQIAGLNLPIFCGQTLVLQERFDPDEAWRLIATEGVTYLAGIPNLYRSLLDHLENVDVGGLKGQLRICGTGAAPLPAAWSEEFEEKLGVPLLPGYGATETTSVVTWNCPSDKLKIESVGRPLPGIQIAIGGTSEENQRPGESAEIYVQSPGVMKGYLNRPDETKQAIDNGWYRTGDIGHLDEEGYLYILGRADDVIIRRDANISPQNIERVIREYPTVRDVAVIGTEGETISREVVAFVVMSDDRSAHKDSFLTWLRGELPDDQVPDDVRLIDSLPRTDTGKVSRRELLESL